MSTCACGPGLTSRLFLDGASRKYSIPSLNMSSSLLTLTRLGCTNFKLFLPSSWRSSSSPFLKTPFALRAHLVESWCPSLRTRTAGRSRLCLCAFPWPSSRVIVYITRRRAITMSLSGVGIILLNACPCMNSRFKGCILVETTRDPSCLGTISQSEPRILVHVRHSSS